MADTSSGQNKNCGRCTYLAKRYDSLESWNILLNIAFASMLGVALLLVAGVFSQRIKLNMETIGMLAVYIIPVFPLYFLRRSVNRRFIQVKQELEQHQIKEDEGLDTKD
jgi:MFS-type transporter involved in bile tolerance (Atg22 family)